MKKTTETKGVELKEPEEPARELTAWEKQKAAKKKRRDKIKLVKILIKDTNQKLFLNNVSLKEETEEEEEKREEEREQNILALSELEHQYYSLKHNKNNSREFSWEPFKGLNRRMRRMKV